MVNAITRRIEGVVVVELSGAMFFGEEPESLRILVKDLLNKSGKIVFDLGNLTHIDSGGVGILVAAYASARKAGRNIRFANLGEHTREVLQITKLATVFQIFDNAEDAIASFGMASRVSF